LPILGTLPLPSPAESPEELPSQSVLPSPKWFLWNLRSIAYGVIFVIAFGVAGDSPRSRRRSRRRSRGRNCRRNRPRISVGIAEQPPWVLRKGKGVKSRTEMAVHVAIGVLWGALVGIAFGVAGGIAFGIGYVISSLRAYYLPLHLPLVWPTVNGRVVSISSRRLGRPLYDAVPH